MTASATYFAKVVLPKDMGPELEAVQEEDPGYLSRVVLYALQRRVIFRHLQDLEEEVVEEMREAVFTPEERAILEELGHATP